MRSLKPLLVAGLSAAALAGLAGVAAARNAHLHTMTVQLPDGGAAQIRYAGNEPPKVVISSAPATFGAWAPAAFAAWPDPFADLDRVAAQMERQMDVALRQAHGLEIAPGGDGYTFVGSGGPGASFCGRSVEITSTGDGKPPQVTSRTWGDCGGGQAAAPAQQQPAKPAVAGKTI